MRTRCRRSVGKSIRSVIPRLRHRCSLMILALTVSSSCAVITKTVESARQRRQRRSSGAHQSRSAPTLKFSPAHSSTDTDTGRRQVLTGIYEETRSESSTIPDSKIIMWMTWLPDSTAQWSLRRRALTARM